MMWYWGGGVHWWGWMLGVLGMVAFWGLLLWAIWYFVTGVARRPDADHRAADPKRILDERLARGEIDADEYKRARDLLTGQPAATDRAEGLAGPAAEPVDKARESVDVGPRH